ncbi:glycoside hydrolase family 35 protein [Nocardiopsis sp. JB363]|uniref:glycoside hydrolase family 35 protein n=1 Tax=Nocardiopsis sp. JB363 TaxID=1434837 RepID=UPI00097A651B|nr:glycoside hydrolase family 35 protein [Nocardiopsis sp. JB363]SIO85216.1 Beta-galactosidase [Nocardiopsis sp. JB363]
MASHSSPGADPAANAPTLTYRDGGFRRNGSPHQIFAGSMHYFRVHPDQWRDRLLRLVDLGLNTVDTYVAWNFHQPRPDEAPDFTGWRDLRRFLETAAEVGLDAIVRPGPYICAEWTNGGLPTWLTAGHTSLRTADSRFLEPVATWFDALLPHVADLQARHGGPVVAVQVENEYGSFGDDPHYVPAIRDLLVRGGISELLYTADGPTDPMLDTGAVDGALIALNFGSRAADARAVGRERRPGEPFFCAEFWNGWFDHWGHPHHVRDAADAAATVADIVADGGSVSLYMAHGGTNFGTWAGANDVDGELRPTVTSYDSDAAVAEDGTLTEKFHEIRKALGAPEAVRSEPPVMVTPVTAPVTAGAGLLPGLRELCAAPVETYSTGAFEEFGFESPLVRYEAEVLLPAYEVELSFQEVRDRALVYVDDVFVGAVTASGSVTVSGHGGPSRVILLVEALGQINYGPRLGERKGLVGPVLVDGRRMIQRWSVAEFPLASWERDAVSSGSDTDPSGAGFAFATVTLTAPADAHLALPGFGKGFVWVNDFLLGRYWEVGPQQTLYVPGPLLRAGENHIVVLELEHRGAEVELRDRPELGPTEEYVETL